MYERNEDEQREVGKSKSSLSPMLIAFVVIGVAVVIFILQNGNSKKTSFLMFDFKAPLWVLLAITLGIGVVLDRLFSFWWKRRRRD